MIAIPSLARAAVTLLALANHKVAVASRFHAGHHHGFDKIGHSAKASSILKSDVPEYTKMTKVDDNVLLYWKLHHDFIDARLVYHGLAWLGFGVSSHESKEIILGKPEKPKKNQVRKYWLKGDKWSEVKRMEEKSQTLGAPSLVQYGSTTIMNFKKRLVEDDEIAIKKRGDNEFFVVIGSENRYHKIKKTHVFSLDLSTEIEAVHDKSNLKPTQSETTKTDAKAKANKATADDKTQENIPFQADEEKKPEETHKHMKRSKIQGVVFVIVGTCIGTISLLALVVGMGLLRRRAVAGEEHFALMEDMDDMDEVADLS
jgi:hypothetical protein